MGRLDVAPTTAPPELRLFTKALLRDLQALEQMLEEQLIERGVRRIGAEQELFLVDEGARPAWVAEEVLSGLGRPEFTTEIDKFNLEINLPPAMLAGPCFFRLVSGVPLW